MELEKQQVITIFEKGDLALEGQFLRGSNYTYLARVTYQENELAVVYKPTRGEQPLWDFPGGSLSRREVAAFLVSEALGWELVPPTVFRRKGPLGPGSIQLYIEHDPEYHYFNFQEDDRARLRPVMCFDLLVNNADRKGSHILVDSSGRLWLIDHGLCFHEEEKLRTVIWDFAGEPIPPELLADLECLGTLLAKPDAEKPAGPLVAALAPLLAHTEINALRRRTRSLIERGCFPPPPTNRRVYPWPPV